ncbi:hypothetical protein TKK_0011192 [Trichogramma kaykai]
MRYKHIVSVGMFLMSIIVLLAALMYYFYQKDCALGTFRCRNTTPVVCIPQNKWCDGAPDCAEEDDEDIEDCVDNKLSIYPYPKPNYNVMDFYCPPAAIDVGNCTYGNKSHDCSVKCQNLDGNVSQNISEFVIQMTITDSNINILRKNDFLRFSRLKTLHLLESQIKILEPNVFVAQKNLSRLIVANNEIEEIVKENWNGLEKLSLFDANCNQIRSIDLSFFENSTVLTFIDLSYNLLTSESLTLPYLPKLDHLNLEDNRLTKIKAKMFDGLISLTRLFLQYNQIEQIDEGAFAKCKSLVELNLMQNSIVALSPNIFTPLGNLTALFLGYNPFKNIPMDALQPLNSSLRTLHLEDIEVHRIEKNAFDIFKELKFLYFKNFYYCAAYTPRVKICRPLNNGVSSYTDLLDKPVLRAAVWGISCVTCLGNALVLWGRFTAKDENRVLSIIIRNLAVSDMLMGFYLFIIGLEDARFRNTYSREIANVWMSSWSCTLIGILAMTSCEVSMLILSFMSIERFLLIAMPFKAHRSITAQTATSAMTVVWIIGITVALVPAILWRNSTRFYGINGMCFPLHIEDPYLVGWEYSAFIFLGLNVLGLMTIGYVYTGMFWSIRKTRLATTLSIGDVEFALRFFLIVLTDFLCWAPIIVMKIMALASYPVSPDWHAWVVIFILPVNSAINPLLYTFTTPKFRERLSEGWFGHVRSYVSRKASSDSHLSNSSLRDNNMIPMSAIVYSNEGKRNKQVSNNEILLINLIKDD